MGQSHEQHPQPGRRNHSIRNDLLLNAQLSHSASSTIILLCWSSQSENSFGLASFFFTACFRCKASFLKASKAACISSRRSAGNPGVFFALLILFRQFWHSFL